MSESLSESCTAGKTELAKQVAKYVHKDKKEVSVSSLLATCMFSRCLSTGVYPTGYVRVSREARGT